MLLDKNFWKNKKVFLTGHTGFKGGWLSLILNYLEAEVVGYSLEPEKNSFFNQVNLGKVVRHNLGDIRDLTSLNEVEKRFKPDILIHMAAQSLVIESYKDPINTFSTNIMGTVNILETIRMSKSIKTGVIITTDKCYENRNLSRGYREDDPMGGFDPYSSSKGSAELVIKSYQRSFLNEKNFKEGAASIASVRAGNVIGGGDWAEERLIPDLLRSTKTRKKTKIRNPSATRPWQHVLEPLTGYLLVVQKLFEEGPSKADNWNFGPNEKDIKPVSYVADLFCDRWGDNLSWIKDDRKNYFHEAELLSLDIEKAKTTLGWDPKWSLDQAITKVVDWHKQPVSEKNLLKMSLSQIEEYLKI